MPSASSNLQKHCKLSNSGNSQSRACKRRSESTHIQIPGSIPQCQNETRNFNRPAQRTGQSLPAPLFLRSSPTLFSCPGTCCPTSRTLNPWRSPPSNPSQPGSKHTCNTWFCGGGPDLAGHQTWVPHLFGSMQ
jgi:hypothetical protein